MMRTIGGVFMAAGVAVGLYVWSLFFFGHVSALDPSLVAVMIERLIITVVGAAVFIVGAVFVAQPPEGKSAR